MNLNLFNLFKSNKAQEVKNETNFIGRTSLGQVNPGRMMGLDLHSDTYASAYPSIRAISNEYMTVLPKAIDGNGKPVKSNILDALYHPNQKDSVVSFNEKLATSTLVLPQTYLLVWRSEGGVAKPGGDFGFKGRNIAGFTFLENPGISQRDGKIYYNIGSQWFTEDEVIVLSGGVNPHNLYGGYSPTEAACRWITLDDYIADFQKGFFENNAIPAGMFRITAKSDVEYEDIVANLKRRHKGAGNNNNVTYSHAPQDPVTGKTAEAKIEWIPFQQSNKDIDFDSLFKQANHRIDQAYGVPAIVKGIDDAATYANAQVAEAGFAKRAVKPLLTRNYAQLTHELNRITGGMGIALTFDYEIPAIADEEKVVAETKMVEANLIRTLTLEGYSLDTIVDAFKLSNGYKLLKKDEAPAVIENDKPQVDEGGEVEKSPDPDVIDGVTPVAKVKAQVSTRDYPDLYEGIDVDPSYLGCIMLDTEKIEILSVVGDGAINDLVQATDRHDHTMGAVAEIEPHVTLLYGLLENGNIWKDKVDTLLDGWSLDTVKVKDIGYFDLPESYAIVAHIEETTDLLEGRNRLTLLPHINTFSDYRPHMTLAYIEKDADLGKWLTTLNAEYSGKELKVTGINYGDLPEEDGEDKPTKAVARGSERTNPKAELTDEEKLKNAARQFMRSQIEREVDLLSDDVVAQETTDDELDAFVVAMMAVISTILLVYGEEGYAMAAGIAGLAVDELRGFTLTDDATDAYRGYLRGVAQSYGSSNAESIRKVLLQSRDNGLNRRETEEALRNILNTDEWRVERLARTELNNSQNIGKLEGAKELRNQVGGVWEKTIDHSGVSGVCPLCASQEGIWTPLDDALFEYGDSITTTDDNGNQVIYINNWQTNEANDFHPNGKGSLIFRRVEANGI